MAAGMDLACATSDYASVLPHAPNASISKLFIIINTGSMKLDDFFGLFC